MDEQEIRTIWAEYVLRSAMSVTTAERDFLSIFALLTPNGIQRLVPILEQFRHLRDTILALAEFPVEK